MQRLFIPKEITCSWDATIPKEIACPRRGCSFLAMCVHSLGPSKAVSKEMEYNRLSMLPTIVRYRRHVKKHVRRRIAIRCCIVQLISRNGYGRIAYGSTKKQAPIKQFFQFAVLPKTRCCLYVLDFGLCWWILLDFACLRIALGGWASFASLQNSYGVCLTAFGSSARSVGRLEVDTG